MKKETIEEYLARGGKIQKVPSKPLEERELIIKVNSAPENRLLSLEEGEFYFSENRANKKAAKTVNLEDVIDQFDLPQEIVDRLRGDNE